MIGVDGDLVALAEWLAGDEEALVETIVARQHEQLPGFRGRGAPLVDASGREATASILAAVRAGLTTGRDAPAHLPPGAVRQVAVAAAERVPWATLARTYAITHAVVWERLIAELGRRQLDAERSGALLQVVSRYLFALVDHLTSELAEVYAAERERCVRDSERRRSALVRDVLAGLPVEGGQLAYELRGEHVGVIAWGAAPGEAIAALAEASGRDALTVPGPGEVVWAWLSGPPSVPVLPADTCVALGDAAAGVEGFRTTHRQACEAHRVALHRSQAVTRYDEVALESLALQDPGLARTFALRELGALGAEDERTTVLRETLRAYFAGGQNAAAAAAMLGVHERTVSYRLQSAGERLGRPVAARRDELAVALRLLAVLEPESTPAAAVLRLVRSA